ncbi:MAG: DUF1573 domain-containing protein [Ferruginibacter sp.]
MRKLLFLSILGCVSLTGFSQENGKVNLPATELKTVPAANENTITDKKAEETLVLKEDVYDFGKIPQGKPVTHIFEVSNIGKTDLKISNVQASCGCTTPEWDQGKPIAAGGSSKITVGYNAAAEGVFTKLVTVTYGDNQSKQITIKGEVWKTPASSAPVNAGLNDLKN